MSKRVCISATVVCVSLVAPPLVGQTMTLSPIQDTYVQDINAGTNFGGSEELWLGRGSFFGLGVIRGLVEFDFSTTPISAEQIRTATFSVYQFATEPAAGGIDTNIHRALAAWDEMSVVWNTQPPFDATIWATARVGDSFYRGWIDWDVTDLVKQQVGGTLPNEGWLFKVPFETAGVSRLGYCHSREYVADPTLRPMLTIELALPGDMNCDGFVDNEDIDPFVLAVTQGQAAYQAAWPNCEFLNGDINGDGFVDNEDIDPFVALITGP